MSKNSLGLAVITKTYNEAKRLVDLYKPYFDEIYVQVNGGGEVPTDVPQNVHISKFKWVNDFSKARNALSKHIKTDFYLWLDTDDDIENPDRLRQLVNSDVDAVYLQYVYGYNEEREPIAVHWRERLIKTSHPFKWVGAVHETLISSEQPIGVKDDQVVIKHAYKNQAEIMASALRNHQIMEEQVKKGDEDPRTLYYLGRSYFMLKRFQESAQTLLIYTEQSGWDEQKYDAWMKIGDALVMMDEYEKAVNANLEAIKLNPGCPDGYLKLGDLYLALEQPSRAIEWLKLGLSKSPIETLEIVDPTLYTYRPLITMAMCYFSLAKVTEAKKWIDKAAQFQPKIKLFKNVYSSITDAYFEELSIRQARVLGQLVEQKGDIKNYMDGLPPFIRNDLRLRPLLVRAHPARKWPNRSIVFYCGEQWEEWGPETLKNGMGGSEEAVTYLSEELANLGWQVTVYNQRVEELTTKAGVNWLPWETFNPEDNFDVFVAWRNPWMCQKLNIKARVKAVDLHDTPLGHQAMPQKALESLDKIFLKGRFQKNMAETPIPDDKAVVISNGIVPEQFDNPGIERQSHKVIYASSADRGLDVLVRKVWPKVKEAIPDAELVWAYGWNSYQAMHKGNAEKMKWMWELKRDMYNAGVKELGRLSHEDLAKEMMSCSIWAYPTSFPEINCITAIKMQAAGVRPITSGYAALQETILKKEDSIEDIDTKPDELEKFTNRLIEALNQPIDKQTSQDIKKIIIKRYGWKTIAREWDRALKWESKIMSNINTSSDKLLVTR